MDLRWSGYIYIFWRRSLFTYFCDSLRRALRGVSVARPYLQATIEFELRGSSTVFGLLLRAARGFKFEFELRGSSTVFGARARVFGARARVFGARARLGLVLVEYGGGVGGEEESWWQYQVVGYCSSE